MESVRRAEEALLQCTGVAQARIVDEVDPAGVPSRTAFVVPRGDWSRQAIEEQLRATLPATERPSWLVFLSSLPLTEEGALDDAVLKVLPISVGRAAHERATETRGRRRTAPRLHLADLIDRAAPAAQATDLTAPRMVAARASGAGPAMARGESLETIASRGDLVDSLAHAAERTPERGITYVLADGTERRQTYAELQVAARRVARGFLAAGLSAGDIVLLQLASDPETIVTFWGAQLAGVVPVPMGVSPDYAPDGAFVKRLCAVWELVGRAPIVASASVIPELTRAGFGGEAARVLDVERLMATPDGPTSHAPRASDTALLLLTSGSTGAPKLVRQTHAALCARSAAAAHRNHFGDEDALLNWFALDHVGGLVMFHLHAVDVAASQVQVATRWVLERPLRWLELVERHRATVTWAPNFAYALVAAEHGELERRRYDLSSMRFLLNGGEAVVAKHARRFLEVLAPHGLSPATMFPAWGMSETCSGVTYSHEFRRQTTSDDDSFVSVGAPVPGFAVRIVDDEGRVLEEGQIGALEVQGAQVTVGYYENPEANAESFTADGWFKTGDLGRLDDGRLTITGRKKDVIIVNGQNFSAHELEARVDDVEGVAKSFSAAFAVAEAGGSTDALVVTFVPKAEDEEAAHGLVVAIRRAITEQFGISVAHVVPLRKEDVPKTNIGKIQRAELRRRFVAGELAEVVRGLDLRLENANTIPAWFHKRVFVRESLSPANPRREVKNWLVLGREDAITAALVSELRGTGARVVRVLRGAAFVNVGDEAAVDPSDASQVRRLFESLGFAPTDVVHLWAYGDEVGASVETLLHVAKGLSAASRGRAPRLSVVVPSIAAVGDVEVDARYGAYPGLVRSIAEELPWLEARLVGAGSAPEASTLAAEVASSAHDAYVAYDGTCRYVLRVARVDVGRRSDRVARSFDGGLYLVTGGLGGVGVHLCRELLRRGAARVLLLGRRPIEALAREERETLAELERAGARYASADVTVEAAVEAVVASAEADTGLRLAGVFHLAAEVERRLLGQTSREALRRALDVKGTSATPLSRLLESRGGGLFVALSSVNGFFGGAGYGAYAAACSLLDSVVDAQRARGLEAYTLDFSAWRQTGLARAHVDEELAAARGFHVMAPEQAIASLFAALELPPGQLFIGLDDAYAGLGGLRHEPPVEVEEQGAEGPDGTVVDRSAVTRVEARLSGIWRRILELDEVSRDSNFFDLGGHSLLVPKLQSAVLEEIGVVLPVVEVFRNPTIASCAEWLSALVGPDPVAAEVEEKIAAIWREVLDLETIDGDANFFDLGGHSLLMPKVLEGLRSQLGIDLPVVELFKNPTLQRLAACVTARRADVAEPRVTAPAPLPIDRGARRTNLLQQRERRK